MSSWTNPTTPREGLGADPWRAVVHPEGLLPRIDRVVLPGRGPLSDWVERIWSLSWADPVPAAFSGVIGHPTVHLTVEAGPSDEIRHGHRLPAALLHGVVTERFALDLPAPGWVIGLHLTPGAIFDLTGTEASTWTGRVVPWGRAGI